MADKDSLENMSPEDKDNLAKLAHGLANNPKTRQMFLRLTKAHAPETSIPEIDVLDTVGAAVKPHLDKIAEMEKKALEREVADRIRERREELREQGHSKEEIEAIEKVMVDHQIPSHKTAAEFFKLQRQTATPTPANFQMNRLPSVTKDQIKSAGSVKRHFIQDAHAAIDDLRAGRVRLH